MPSLTLHATAKVNLYLHVTGKREDGYHLLDSLVAFPKDVYDVLSFEQADEFVLGIDGPFSKDLSADPSNLIIKAVNAVSYAAGRSSDLSIRLTKNIPLGSGLGGGSADAAATVHGLQKFWDIELPAPTIQDILISLGADVPICYANHACRFQGIGEKISDVVALSPLHILLIWPGKPSFTRDVFARYKPHSFAPLPENLPSLQNKEDFLAFLKITRNDLQDPAESLCDEIRQARQFMKNQQGCLFTRMTGSGASVFGLFESQDVCKAAQKNVPLAWWSQSSPL